MEQQPFKRVGQENFTTTPKDTGSASKKRGLKTLNEEREDARTHWCGIVVGVVSHLAEISWEASQTQALKSVHFVLAAAAVQTRRARALVDVPLAVLAGEPRRARAPIAVYQVLGKRGRKRVWGREAGANLAQPQIWLTAFKGWGPNNNCQTRAQNEQDGGVNITATQLFQHIFLARAQRNNVYGNSI